MFFSHNIHQDLHISVLILCFIFNIRLPIYKHVFFNPKQSPRILYLSIILESLKNTLDSTIYFIIFILRTATPTYNKGCTSRSIHNNDIPKGGKHISDGSITTYNDNIHQNIFQSYKYINTPY